MNFQIKKAKKKYYEIKFKKIVDSKKTWQAIREIGMCNKNNNCDNKSAIDINDLNEKLVNLPLSVIPISYYENFTFILCL